MGKRLALIIGVNHYDDSCFNDHHGVIRDATEVAGLLKYRLPPAYRFETVLHTNPMAGQVENALDKIRKQLTTDSTVFLFRRSWQTLRSDGSAATFVQQRGEIGAGRLSTNGGITPQILSDFALNIPADLIMCFDVCRSAVAGHRGDDTGGVTVFRDIGVRPAVVSGGRQPLRWSISSCENEQLAGCSGQTIRAPRNSAAAKYAPKEDIDFEAVD